MKLHRLCKLFPTITGPDFAALVLDIKRNGQRQPIATYEGQILDGGNRFAACTAAGIEPKFEPFTGDDALAFVISQNMNRRHLTDDQRAAIATQIAKTKHGGDRGQGAESDPSEKAITTAQAAALMKVSKRQVKLAKQVKKESPSAFEKVKKGEMSLNAAHEKNHPRKPKPAPSPLKGVDTEKLDAPEQNPRFETVATETVGGVTFHKTLDHQTQTVIIGAPLSTISPENEAEPHDPSDPAQLAEKELTPGMLEYLAEQLPKLDKPMTVKRFEQEIKVMEVLANEVCAGNQKERDKYGTIANALAGRLLNPIPGAPINFYGR